MSKSLAKTKKKNTKKYLVRLLWFAMAIFALEIIAFYLKIPKMKNPYLYQIISTGQSLSVGVAGQPVLSTVQPFNNKMLDSFNTHLVALVEPSNTLQRENGETMGSAMANGLSARNGNDFQTVVTNNGVGGYGYDELKKGTLPYSIGIEQTEAVKNEAQRLGKVHKVIGVTTIHGEYDQAEIANDWQSWKQKGYNNPEDVYADFLKQWQRDYESDVQKITGQTETIPLYTDQMSSHTGMGSATPISALGQLKAAEENPGKIILVSPKYFLNYADSLHLDNYSYRMLGEYYAKVIDQVFVHGENWLPLSPIEIKRENNFIFAKFHIPSPATKIEFDTVSVDQMPNMGFEYWDQSGKVSIENVEIVSSDTVKITLSGVPQENELKFLRYAYTGTPGAAAGAHSNGSAKGNLRDNDPIISAYEPNLHLYNWAVHFSKQIN